MACSERTRSNDAGIETFIDLKRESSGWIGNGEVAEGEERVETAKPRRGAKGPQDSMRLVREGSGESEREERNGEKVTRK